MKYQKVEKIKRTIIIINTIINFIEKLINLNIYPLSIINLTFLGIKFLNNCIYPQNCKNKIMINLKLTDFKKFKLIYQNGKKFVY